MIARTLRGLGALAAVLLGLLGWPAALLAIGDGVSSWLPDLADPLSLLSRPDTGGLFLVIVLALAWAAWLVWSVALVLEISSQVRGVPTPRLSGLFPQGATAALVTTIAMAFAYSPGVALAAPATQTNSVAASSDSTSAAAADGPAATSTGQPDADDVHDYTVRRGDTLWDIADEHLDDPARYPEIAEASAEIAQPDGRQLEDPDLILPGWTLHIPTPPNADAYAEVEPEPGDVRPSELAEQVPSPATPMRPASSAGDTSQPSGALAAPPSTPMDHQAAVTSSRGGGGPRGASSAIPSAGAQLPSTPLGAGTPEPVELAGTPMSGATAEADRGRQREDTSVVGLPAWITAPLVPMHPGNAEDLVAAANTQLATRSSG
jgi:LysM repeat protein